MLSIDKFCRFCICLTPHRVNKHNKFAFHQSNSFLNKNDDALQRRQICLLIKLNFMNVKPYIHTWYNVSAFITVLYILISRQKCVVSTFRLGFVSFNKRCDFSSFRDDSIEQSFVKHLK